jgi:hypothetical protein
MKKLVLIAPAAIVVFLVARRLVPAAAEEVAYVVEVVLLAILAAAGGWLGGHRFERGDYLHTAWYASAGAYLALAVSAPLKLLGQGTGIVIGRGVLTFAANVLSVSSMWLFARAYRVAGIDLGSRTRKVTAGTVAALLAFGIAGVQLVQAARDLFGGRLLAMVNLFGDAGDVATIALIAPILLTALALRGGILTWPWAFIAAANICWLLDDAQGLLETLVPSASGGLADAVSEMWRVAACGLFLAAGLAQRRLLAPETPTRPPS